MARIGIAGAGVLGRLLAWRLAREGHAVQVFDPAPGPDAPPTGSLLPGQPHAAGFTAAGMLSPQAELDCGDVEVARLGWRSLPRWRAIANALGGPLPLMRQHGSLLLAHGSDQGAAQRVLARLTAAPELPRPEALDAARLRQLEPAVAPGLLGWTLPHEGQVLPRETLQALAQQTPGAQWHWGRRVQRVLPGELLLDDGQALRCDLAIDTRGLGAREQVPGGLRGVRGEIVWLHTPGVSLQRPLRLLHPRHRVYLVPRPNDLIVVGASEIESEDRSPVSLRSAVELMAAAHSVLPALAEARVVHQESNLRPATPDHAPVLQHQPGLLRLNGLFRHGWLIAPALVDDALAACGLAPLVETAHA
jgi:glycine oxidase